MTLDGAVVGNAIAFGTAALGAWVLLGTRARRTWSAAIARRSPVAFGAVVVFASLAFLDSLAWTAGDPLGRPRPVIDRLFPADCRERSHWAPLAQQRRDRSAPLT